MKMRLIIVLGIVCCLVGFTVQLMASSPTPGFPTVQALSGAAVATLAAEGEHTYVGSKKCKMCHIKQHKSWAKTKMGMALETLKPGKAVETKKKFNLDPKKDYSTDATCLKCHTTGYGAEGGYQIPDPEDKKAVRKAKALAGVGCESCHGPGSEYIKVFMDIFKSKRKYDVEELYAVGLTKMDANACAACHNADNPTNDPDESFDFEKRKDEGTHEHLELKQRK